MKALLEDVAESGIDELEQSVFRSVGDGVYEFKERGGLARVWGYFDPERRRIIVLVLARRKNPGSGDKSKEQSKQIARAKKLSKRYKANPLQIEV